MEVKPGETKLDAQHPFVAPDCLKSNRFPTNIEASSGTVAR
jgi:hypothetical protein